MFNPGLEEFLKHCETGKRVAVILESEMKGETPLSVMEKLGLVDKPVCLLESGKGSDNSARYSLLGFEPFLTFRSRGTVVEITGKEKATYTGVDPYVKLQEIIEAFPGVRIGGEPKFWGGAMGYFSYDIGRHFEQLPELSEDDLEVPEAYFMFCDKVICFDHVEKVMKIAITTSQEQGIKPETVYWEARKEASRLLSLIKQPIFCGEITIPSLNPDSQKNFLMNCNVTKEQFEEMVAKAKEYIKAGDIFQVNLSLRLMRETAVHPFFLYKILRQINPSPYMSFIDFGDMQIVSSSPELLVRMQGDLAETRPIAGTRKRGHNREEDIAMMNELISNEKERAEHIMLVDLERNDLGRVCRYGTVEVDELMVIEEYSHVMHIVSNVRGSLEEGKNRFDLFKACFPGGTITGAPKIRSMEIIEELEPTRRGPYTGSIGFFGYGGEMEMNIVIRTILMKDGKAYVQAGAGIVADSVPEREYFESMKKAEALLRALQVAEELVKAAQNSREEVAAGV